MIQTEKLAEIYRERIRSSSNLSRLPLTTQGGATMRWRILCMVCCVCAYVKLFRGACYKTSSRYAPMLIHGLISLEGQVNCKRLCESWQDDVPHQRLIHFLNQGQMDLNLINQRRVEQVLPLMLRVAAQKESCGSVTGVSAVLDRPKWFQEG